MTHRRTKTVEYKTWLGLKERCNQPKHTSFKYYGGRGIKVCPQWISSFEQFFQDMGLRPSPRHTIERIDTNKDYEPANCRWATRAEQANNRRNNVLLTLNGRTQALIQWANELSLGVDMLRRRIRVGWTPERALTTPKSPYWHCAYSKLHEERNKIDAEIQRLGG